MANEFVARKGLISSGSVVVSGSLTASFFTGDGSQLTNVIPANVVSSSTQVTALLPTGTVSSSGQVSYTGLSGVPSGIISSSTQLPSGTVSSSAQVSYTGLSNIPSSIVSSSAQVTSLLPTGTVSASSQVDVRNTTGIATLATTGSNTFKGTQTVTGSLYTSGSNTLIGNTVLSGSLIVSGTVGTSTPNIQIYGDTDINGYLQFNPVSTNINTSISASYIYVSGSTQDLYFSQNGNGYNNITRLRWLESNLYTGILTGGVLTSTPGSTTFNISAGQGLIVALNASTTQDPYPVVQRVVWSTQSNIPIKYSGSAKITYVGLDNTGAPVQQTNSWGSSDITQWDTQIQLGVVLHLSGSVSTGVFNSPQISYGAPQKVDDFTRAFGPLKISGHTLQASGSTLGLVKTSGNSFHEGSNYTVDPNHPSTVVESAITTSKVFRYYLSGSTPIIDTGVANAGYTVIDPTKYVDITTGTLTTVSGNNPNQYQWTIQRVFWVPNSPTNAFIVYYGNNQYLSLLDANAALATEPFTEAPNTAQNAIFVGYIIARRDCTSLTDTTTSAIIQAGLFRSVAGVGASTSAAITAKLTDLSDVALTSVSTGDMLVYGADGSTQWVNSKQLSGNYGITGSLNVMGTISGSVTLPSNIVSSSTQVATLLPTGTVSSSAQATTWTVATASYALSNAGTVTSAETASYVFPSGLPAGTVSSSTQVSYTGLSNIPSGIFSSSAQLPAGTVSSSGQVSYTGLTGVPAGIVSSSAQVTPLLPTGTISSSTQVVASLPANTISSSTQFTSLTAPFTGSFTGSFTGTLPFTGLTSVPTLVSSSGQVSYTGLTGVPAGIVSSSTQVTPLLPAGTVSSSGQVSYTGLTGVPSGIVSSSTQVTPLLPTGTVSSSTQVVAALPSNTISSSTQFTSLTAPFTGSFTGSFTGTLPFTGLTNTPTLVSSSGQISYTGLSSIPAGIVSSSTQVTPLLPTGTVSSSGQVSYTGLSSIPVGIVSSSAQFTSLTAPFTGSFTGSHTGTFPYGSLTSIPSGIISSSTQLPSGIVSSSGQVSYTGLSSIPSGIVSSSTQVAPLLPTGTVSSSGQITYSSISSIPSGIISSSAQLPTGTVSSSGQISYTGLSNIPSGIVSSSAQVTPLLPTGTVSSSTQASTWTVATGSYSVTASYALTNAGTVTNATSASYSDYALTASYAMNGGGGGSVPAGTVSSSVQTIANISASAIQPSTVNGMTVSTLGANTAIGVSALSGNTTGVYSVAVGEQALYLGSNNTSTAVGYQALYSATGASNTALGYQAGQNATGTTNAIFIGIQPGTTAMNSSYSTVIGYQAGLLGGSNTSTIMIGQAAGYGAASGSDSIFIGHDAGNTQHTASSAISIGNSAGAGANNTIQSVYLGTNTGYQATDNIGTLAIGSNAGYQATGSSNSVWIGGYAGYQSSNALYGVYIGTAAGKGIQNAVGNVMIGNIAGYVGGNGASGTTGQLSAFNVIIGNQITLPAGSSNMMNLGGVIFTTNIHGQAGLYTYEMITGSRYEAGYGSSNVGINTSAPTHNLHVVGNGRFTTGLTVSGSLISCGNNNIATNTALGVSALNANTSGTSNVAIGYQTLNANQGGSNNIAIGSSALYNNTSASNNVAIGYTTLFLNTGQENIAIGGSALNSNGSTSYNTAVGYQALYSHTAGAQNTAIGWSAMSGVTAGGNNTALGNSTLSGVSGSNNVAVGHNAGSSLTAGANNIIIGQSAQASSTTVDNEITLGNANITKFRVPALNWNVTSTQHTISGSFAVSGSGTFTGNVTAQSLTETSTIRMKENVQPIESTLQTVQLLQPVRFDWKASKVADIGLIAEQVNEIYPEFVDRDINGNPLGIHYSKLTVVLIKAIQELTARLDTLEEK